MDFDLTEDQRAYQQTARDFARDRLLPNAGQWDLDRHFPADTAQAVEIGSPGLFFHRSAGQEQAAFIHGIIDHVEKAADNTRGHRRTYAQDHITYLAYGVIR